MPLEFKPDWEEARDRYGAFWQHELVDRCCVSVTAPRDDAPADPPPPLPPRVEDRWLDEEYVVARSEWSLRRTFWGGEAFPHFYPGYPFWSCQAAYLGSPVHLDENTGWGEPTLAAGPLTDHDYRNLRVDPANRYYRLWLSMLRGQAECAPGRFIPTVGAFGACGDTLATLRGTQRLLLDLYECPDYVREFDLYLTRQWIELCDEFHAIIAAAGEGTTSWFTLWSPGKTFGIQNDFAYMISPRMFQEIFLPSIELQTQYLDHTVYHVDGVGNFAHVGALVGLPRLQTLQILPGAGKPSPLYYMDVLRQVQAAGKNLHISIPPGEVETALRALSPRGLFLETWCATEGEARRLLAQVTRWTSERPARSG